jgi:hypothetical protein
MVVVCASILKWHCGTEFSGVRRITTEQSNFRSRCEQRTGFLRLPPTKPSMAGKVKPASAHPNGAAPLGLGAREKPHVVEGAQRGHGNERGIPDAAASTGRAKRVNWPNKCAHVLSQVFDRQVWTRDGFGRARATRGQKRDRGANQKTHP